jgi:hypothetical protein
VTLVSALLVMALISAIAIGLSVVVLSQVNTTRDINFAVSSYYSADSALDQGLWIIKQARRDNLDITSTLAKLTKTGALSDARATWKRTAVAKNETVKFDLGAEQVVSVELYNPASADYANAPQKIKVAWTDPTGLANIQVSWVGWVPAGFVGGNGDFFPFPNDSVVNISDSSRPTRIYLRIRAKDHGVTNLTVQSFKSDDTLIDIPSQITLTVTGNFPTGALSSKQALSASVPWILPLSGLYSYVLYSEDPIDKP